jgi:hypothetical protein
MKVSCQLHAPAVLPPGKKIQCPISRKLSEPHKRSGHYEVENDSCLPRDTKPRFSSLWPRHYTGHTVAQLVEALRFKPEGRVFDSRWCNWNVSLT